MKSWRVHLGRWLFLLLLPILKLIRFKTRRTRCLIVAGNEVLLTKTWISRQRWSLPGGGIGRGETILEGVRREVFEELGLKIKPKDFRRLGMFVRREGGFRMDLETFVVRLPAKPALKPDRWELIETGWFKLADLPEPRAPLVAWAIKRAGL